MALTTGSVPRGEERPGQSKPRKAPNPLRDHQPPIQTVKLVPKDRKK